MLATDYSWTPRQREVLDLITRGKSNQQIADTLGISLDGAKWHMREILSKLGVDTREEAAEYWRRYNGVAPRFSRLFRGVAGAGAVKWVPGGLVAAAVIGVAFIGVVLAFGDDDEPGAIERDHTQESTSATPPDSTLAATPTVDPTLRWQPVPPGPCPLQDELVCNMAVELEAAFRMGDLDAVMDTAEPFTITCPARQDMLSDFVCRDAGAGALREAYASGKWGGAAGLLPPDALRTVLGDRIASATLDANGERNFRIGAVGCGVPERAIRSHCELFAIALIIPSSSGDGVLRLALRRTGEQARIFAMFNDVPWNEDLRGGKYAPLSFGTGGYFPAASGYFYPWSPRE